MEINVPSEAANRRDKTDPQFVALCLKPRTEPPKGRADWRLAAPSKNGFSLTPSKHSTAGGLLPPESRVVKMLYHRLRQEAAAVLRLGALQKVRRENRSICLFVSPKANARLQTDDITVTRLKRLHH